MIVKFRYIVVLFFFFLPGVAVSQGFWTIGPKFGFTFGDPGAGSFGVEVSYLPENPNFLYGFTGDITIWKGHLSIHTGIEGWMFVGVDIGPTLFFSSQGMNPGMSIILWDGIFLYPYYEFGIPFNGPAYRTVGGYIKFPIPPNSHYRSFSFG